MKTKEKILKMAYKKKKGKAGKACWKGYRRGKGNSCHKMKRR